MLSLANGNLLEVLLALFLYFIINIYIFIVFRFL